MRSYVIGLSLLIFSAVAEANYKQELTCLTAAIHQEASIESKDGKIAVAHVILNRTKLKKYNNTVCGVIKEPGQFQWFSPNKIQYVKENSSIAHKVLTGKLDDPTNGATHFHNLKVKPKWSKTLDFKIQIGSHKFYRDS
jgi:spore germination cell wall hydrolase CwlJ-like protein